MARAKKSMEPVPAASKPVPTLPPAPPAEVKRILRDLAENTSKKETISERRAREKIAREQYKKDLLTEVRSEIIDFREKLLSWSEISEIIFEASQIRISVREIKESVGAIPPREKKSQPAPQTPSPAEPTEARRAGGAGAAGTSAAAPRTAPPSNAAKKSE